MAGGPIADEGRHKVACSVEAAVARAAALTGEARRLAAASGRLREEAGRARRQRTSGPLGAVGFRMVGSIDGDPVVAEWTGQGVAASEPLLVRADLVVRLGEVFVGADGSAVPASLGDGPSRALLTLMRACDRVESVSVKLGPPLGTRAAGGRPGLRS